MTSERVISIFLAVYRTTLLFGSFPSRLHLQSWCLHAHLGDRKAFHPLHHCFTYFAFLVKPSWQLHFSCQKGLIMLIILTQCCFFFLISWKCHVTNGYRDWKDSLCKERFIWRSLQFQGASLNQHSTYVQKQPMMLIFLLCLFIPGCLPVLICWVFLSYLDSKILGPKLPQLCVPVGSDAKECWFFAEPLRNKNYEKIIVRFLVNLCYCSTVPISKYIQHGLRCCGGVFLCFGFF